MIETGADRGGFGMGRGSGRMGTRIGELQKGLEQILREADIIDRITKPGDLRLTAESVSEIRVRLNELRQLCEAGRIAYPCERLAEMMSRFRDFEGRVKELRNDREAYERTLQKKNGQVPCRHEEKFRLWPAIKRLWTSFRKPSCSSGNA